MIRSVCVYFGYSRDQTSQVVISCESISLNSPTFSVSMHPGNTCYTSRK